MTPAQETGTSRHRGGGFVHEGTQPRATPFPEQGDVPAGQAPPSGAGVQSGAAPPQVHSWTQA
jgi:hypothetical protein